MQSARYLIDVSHASDATLWHALETTQQPVIASHSRCRALSNSTRDLSDDMLVGIPYGKWALK